MFAPPVVSSDFSVYTVRSGVMCFVIAYLDVVPRYATGSMWGGVVLPHGIVSAHVSPHIATELAIYGHEKRGDNFAPLSCGIAYLFARLLCFQHFKHHCSCGGVHAFKHL